MTTTGRKPYFATNYQDMMRHIYMKPKGHSEGRKAFAEEDYHSMEYPQLNHYNGGAEDRYPVPGADIGGIAPGGGGGVDTGGGGVDTGGGGVGGGAGVAGGGGGVGGGGGGAGGGAPWIPPDYCRIPCDAVSPLWDPCDDYPPCHPRRPCDSCACPCIDFTFPAQTATAPVTICPSDPICFADVSGGSEVDGCIYVPDEGCGTKNVCVTDICGNEVCTEVRMSSGTWVLQSTTYPANACSSGYWYAACGCSGSGSPEACTEITGGTKVTKTYHHLSGWKCSLSSHPGWCPVSSCTTNSWCDATDGVMILLCCVSTYTWECP